MKYAAVLNLLRDRAGLDPGSLGASAVRAAITSRLVATGTPSLDAYAALVARDAEEFQTLLEEVIVPETWFFRGGALFSHLVERVRASKAEPFRVLSLPCSTGEEPYTLAIALHESGVPGGRFVIDGVDISARNLDLARRGVYPDLSFRQTEPGIRARYFRPVVGGWQLGDEIRRAVRFAIGNILDPVFLPFERAYDLVFCRNLLIYLTPAARQKARVVLCRLVTPGGLLCLGHAEPLDPDDALFERTGPDGTFLYRRLPAEPPRLPSPPVARPTKPASVKRPPEAPSAPALADVLAQARRQADGGELTQALAACQEAMQQHGPSAELYSLIGVIEQARHEDERATEAFRKALYLDREHREALLHLMLLSQRQGDERQAELLRRRLERLGAE